MPTTIYTTKKLERLVKHLITSDKTTEEGVLGKWNATVFYVDRKKCWLITNEPTKYNVTLTDVNAAVSRNIDVVFINALYQQFLFDRIEIGLGQMASIIGQLHFKPTNNDRSITGFQNHRLQELEGWKHEFGSLENMPMNELVHRMNTQPTPIGKGRKFADFTNPIREMKNTLTSKVKL